MISLAEIFSNKNIKRPVIGAFLNSSDVVWTTGPHLPGLVMKSIIKGKEGILLYSTSKWRSLKPRPNDRNMPTQHILTLLGAAGCVRLATVLRCVATCWVLLAQV